MSLPRITNGDTITLPRGIYVGPWELRGLRNVTIRAAPAAILTTGQALTWRAADGGGWVAEYPYNVNAITALHGERRVWTYATLEQYNEGFADPGIVHVDDFLYYNGADPTALVVSTANYCLSIVNCENVTIEGLALTVGGVANVGVQDSQRVVLRDCVMRYAKTGIQFKQRAGMPVSYNVVDNCDIGDDWPGWTFEQVKEHRPSQMETSGVTLRGVQGERNEVRNCRISNKFDGVQVGASDAPGANFTLIHNNAISDIVDDCVEADNYHIGTRIYGNMLSGGVGVSCEPHPGGPTYIYDNVMYASRRGTKISSAQRVSINDNVITGDNIAVGLGADCADIEVLNNKLQVHDTAGGGGTVRNFSAGQEFAGNLHIVPQGAVIVRGLDGRAYTSLPGVFGEDDEVRT